MSDRELVDEPVHTEPRTIWTRPTASWQGTKLSRPERKRLLFVVAVQCPAVRHDRVLGDQERARSMRVTTEEQMDLVGNERQRWMKTPQPSLLPVASDAARQHRDPEPGEREALHQLEISAGQETRRECIDRREVFDHLLALENAAREDQRTAPQPFLRGIEVVGSGRALRPDEEVDRVAKELHLYQVRMWLGIHHDPEMDRALHRGVENQTGRSIGERDLDARIAFEELGHPLRQEVGAQRFVATDDEAAGFVRLQAFDPLLELLQPHQRFIGVSQELLARAGQRHARSQADQQLGPEALFELFDDRRQARLADLKHARGGGKTPAPRDGLKVAQMVQHAPLAWYHPIIESAA